MTIQFKKAIKYDAKGRVALVGPAGSGKSYTMLQLARAMAGHAGKIAAIDTEHGSLSKYADLFDFDVFELDSFTPDNFQAALTAAEQNKYDVFCCDSLSHFWTGRDGALEFVDMASKRHKDQMGGWKDFRPHERAMVDRMVASPCHVIVSMRTKTEYAEEVDQRTGKKKRVKVGLQPVQREGLEYEFDLVGYMDEANTLIVDKTRCPYYTDKALSKPAAKDFAPFIEWLKGVQREMPAVATTPNTAPIPTGPAHNPGPAAAPAEDPDPALTELYKWAAQKGGTPEVFAEMHSDLVDLLGFDAGDAAFQKILGAYGKTDIRQFKSMTEVRKCMKEMYEAIRSVHKAPPEDAIDIEAEVAA